MISAVRQDIVKRFFAVAVKVFGLYHSIALFSNFDLFPVNFIGHLDTETTLFSIQFLDLGLEII